MAIGVVAMGSQKTQVDYRNGITVQEVLSAAKITAPGDSTVTVNGKQAKATDKVQDRSQVVVTPKVSNG